MKEGGYAKYVQDEEDRKEEERKQFVSKVSI